MTNAREFFQLLYRNNFLFPVLIKPLISQRYGVHLCLLARDLIFVPKKMYFGWYVLKVKTKFKIYFCVSAQVFVD